jgi:nitric oxide reductase activation protein
MKGHMHSYLDTARQTIFNHAADTVKDQLKAMCDKICQELWALVLENIFKNLSRDYLSVLGSDDTRTISVLTRTERMLRGELSHMLTQDADKAFKDCIPVAEAPTPDQAEEDRSAGDSLDDYKSAEEQPDGAQFDEDEQSIGAQFDEEEQSIGAQFDEEAQYTAAQSVDSPNPPEEMQASNGWFDMGDSKQESVHNAPVDTP